MHAIFEGGQLFEAHGTARMHAPRRDSDLAAEAEFAAVGELRRGIVDHDGGVDLVQERAAASAFSVTMQSV